MNQSERRKYLIKELLGEQPRYKDIEISENNIEQKKLLRSLMNVRMAAPISPEFEKRACRGTSASMTSETFTSWENEHVKMLEEYPEKFLIKHYISIAWLRKK